MKKIILSLAAFFPLLVLSQQNFEGVINYKGYSTTDSGQFLMTISYGKFKMKVEGRKTGKHDNDVANILIDLKQGIQYTIDSLEESIEIDSLKVSDFADVGGEFLPTETTKKLLDQPARLYQAKAEPGDSLSLVPESMVAIWFSEGIKYIIPEPYRNKRSLITNPEGNFIWLEFSIFFRLHLGLQKLESDTPLVKRDTVIVKAISIDQRPLPDSIFNLPKNFNITYREHGSIDEPVTETEKVEEVKKPTPKNSSPKSSQPIKSPEKKEKESKPVKG